jgi:4-hydroxybenzoate polyprenyltransferase
LIRFGRGLALSCHPIPTLAVTTISGGLAALADVRLGTAVLLVLAVFAGQLSIGWSNDRIDAGRDREVQRSDKPAAAGELPLGVVTVAAAGALVAAIALSLTLGYRAGAAALVVVACGWAYNLGLKATALSWLPYAIAFGTLPAIATLAAPAHRLPALWAIAAGALLGVAAHFGNVLPDLATDARTGVRGLPHRMGARASMIAGPVLLLAATASIVFGPAGRIGAARVFAMVFAAALAALAIGSGLRHPNGRVFFLATVLVAIADVALFGLSGGHLS